MKNKVSKSQFKPRALEYFRQVQLTGQELIITDHARPVLKIVPFTDDPLAALQELRGSVISFDRPTDPVGDDDWEALS